MSGKQDKPKKGLYMVQADLDYFRRKFRGGTPESEPITPDLLAEFISYSDFVEENYQYNFVFKAFPSVFLPKRLGAKKPEPEFGAE